MYSYTVIVLTWNSHCTLICTLFYVYTTKKHLWLGTCHLCIKTIPHSDILSPLSRHRYVIATSQFTEFQAEVSTNLRNLHSWEPWDGESNHST